LGVGGGEKTELGTPAGNFQPGTLYVVDEIRGSRKREIILRRGPWVQPTSVLGRSPVWTKASSGRKKGWA